MITTLTAQVEVAFKEGKKTIDMIMREPHEIEECKEDTVVVLSFRNGETYTGYFRGMDGDNIMLRSLTSITTLGINQRGLTHFFEQVVSDK